MAGKSQYFENIVLNWMKGTTAAAAPATTYMALFTTAPTDDAGASSVEVSGGSYARIGITSSTGWSSISGAPAAPAQISNSGVVTFATPSASWGTIVAIGIYDALTVGNLLWWNSITSQAIGTGIVASFAIGAIVLTED